MEDWSTGFPQSTAAEVVPDDGSFRQQVRRVGWMLETVDLILDNKGFIRDLVAAQLPPRRLLKVLKSTDQGSCMLRPRLPDAKFERLIYEYIKQVLALRGYDNAERITNVAVPLIWWGSACWVGTMGSECFETGYPD